MKFANNSNTLLASVLLSGLAFNASALDILISNDDGFETANVRALYKELKTQGHNVI